MKRSVIILFLCASFVIQAQFKADNVKYTTVFPEDLCKTLKENKGYLLLDVRSPGEFDDTSASTGLNIGHLKNAKNINITQLAQRWKEISSYKDQPVFIYCSHSQRSRRASRLLADSGFTKIFNINGGLTNFYDQGIQADPCSGYSIQSSIPYKIISSQQLAANWKNVSYSIVDLRTDSVFRGIGNERSKNEGKFCDAINIPFEKFMTQNDFTANKPVLLVDEFGDQSPKAAKMLIDKGIKDVTILFDGMDGWMDYSVNNRQTGVATCNAQNLYKVIPGHQFAEWMKYPRAITVIDVRSKEEFGNKSKNYWQNIGQVKNAINIPANELKTSTSLPQAKIGQIVVYGFNSQPEIFEAAKWLKDQGYKNVAVLQGGIWRLRWAAHNIKGNSDLNDLVLNVPPENE